MKASVKVYTFPDGERLVTNADDASAKAEALRLGMLSALEAALRKHDGQRCASAIARDGNRIVAIIAWAGFAAASENGWVSITATPACEKTADWLVRAAHRLIERPAIRFVEGGAPWKN